MSLQDDYFDLTEWMKDQPEDMKKAFSNIWDWSIEAELEITQLLTDNNAMRKVIQIINESSKI